MSCHHNQWCTVRGTDAGRFVIDNVRYWQWRRSVGILQAGRRLFGPVSNLGMPQLLTTHHTHTHTHASHVMSATRNVASRQWVHNTQLMTATNWNCIRLLQSPLSAISLNWFIMLHFVILSNEQQSLVEVWGVGEGWGCGWGRVADTWCLAFFSLVIDDCCNFSHGPLGHYRLTDLTRLVVWLSPVIQSPVIKQSNDY